MVKNEKLLEQTIPLFIFEKLLDSDLLNQKSINSEALEAQWIPKLADKYHKLRLATSYTNFDATETVNSPYHYLQEVNIESYKIIHFYIK